MLDTYLARVLGSPKHLVAVPDPHDRDPRVEAHLLLHRPRHLHVLLLQRPALHQPGSGMYVIVRNSSFFGVGIGVSRGSMAYLKLAHWIL